MKLIKKLNLLIPITEEMHREKRRMKLLRLFGGEMLDVPPSKNNPTYKRAVKTLTAWHRKTIDSRAPILDTVVECHLSKYLNDKSQSGASCGSFYATEEGLDGHVEIIERVSFNATPPMIMCSNENKSRIAMYIVRAKQDMTVLTL
jgi:hypothetical protein